MKYRSAKRLVKVIGAVSDLADAVMTWCASFLGICESGKKVNWFVVFARMFYTECPCCLFYRGVTIGVMVTVALTMLVSSIF